MSRAAALLGLAAILLFAASPLPAQGAPLTVRVDPVSGAPLLAVGPVLDDPALREAVQSGLPLRLRFRVELWRDEWFDDLVGQQAWSAVLAYEPLGRLYLAGADSDETLRRLGSYDEARATLERVWTAPVAPRGGGRFYYLATLEIETLALSDLDELGRWLGGELEPAVRGSGSVSGAVGTGVKRLLIRILDLPARRFAARSGGFER